jgi:hypothetical protein
MMNGIDPNEHVRSLTHPPVKEGSAITNNLLAIQQAKAERINEQLERIKAGFLFPPTYRTYTYYRTEYPSISAVAWEQVFGASRTAEWEFRFLLEEYGARVEATGSAFVCLGRACDAARADVEAVKELGINDLEV